MPVDPRGRFLIRRGGDITNSTISAVGDIGEVEAAAYLVTGGSITGSAGSPTIESTAGKITSVDADRSIEDATITAQTDIDAIEAGGYGGYTGSGSITGTITASEGSLEA